MYWIQPFSHLTIWKLRFFWILKALNWFWIGLLLPLTARKIWWFHWELKLRMRLKFAYNYFGSWQIWFFFFSDLYIVLFFYVLCTSLVPLSHWQPQSLWVCELRNCFEAQSFCQCPWGGVGTPVSGGRTLPAQRARKARGTRRWHQFCWQLLPESLRQSYLDVAVPGWCQHLCAMPGALMASPGARHPGAGSWHTLQENEMRRLA